MEIAPASLVMFYIRPIQQTYYNFMCRNLPGNSCIYYAMLYSMSHCESKKYN